MGKHYKAYYDIPSSLCASEPQSPRAPEPSNPQCGQGLFQPLFVKSNCILARAGVKPGEIKLRMLLLSPSPSPSLGTSTSSLSSAFVFVFALALANNNNGASQRIRCGIPAGENLPSGPTSPFHFPKYGCSTDWVSASRHSTRLRSMERTEWGRGSDFAPARYLTQLFQFASLLLTLTDLASCVC
ncbi:hypothetical protein EDB81DRAFT_408774 [Dactylonectria macrodidyma]|uniref:Uncharacterized protein n=1 Tax=Dactylonectria macrodidyma TaxID=307937 RepID=A0A9P9FBJ4_9HYPO|nr:hypothetical protein EDB81DRAFT_408774 [Dactylonectria macrodidyma]